MNHTLIESNLLNQNSVVRHNLMNERGYRPYCGVYNCKCGMPRTRWNSKKEQFVCQCGFVTEFPKEFILEYKKRWNI